jgi:hypothetical protein
MIAWFTALPGWLLTHPWAVAGCAVLVMPLSVLALLFNRNDRQVREILRRKK